MDEKTQVLSYVVNYRLDCLNGTPIGLSKLKYNCCIKPLTLVKKHECGGV